ncbi:hypothetical protein WMY93_026063 [Mugilogobius chulae]|uniref:Uncharacterized protein n=1 Tax=Mugilogobius chulae TaxID=88201 RepID=A0AAW0MWE9_9GOBI
MLFLSSSGLRSPADRTGVEPVRGVYGGFQRLKKDFGAETKRVLWAGLKLLLWAGLNLLKAELKGALHLYLFLKFQTPRLQLPFQPIRVQTLPFGRAPCRHTQDQQNGSPR